jgi:hypothetical protein
MANTGSAGIPFKESIAVLNVIGTATFNSFPAKRRETDITTRDLKFKLFFGHRYFESSVIRCRCLRLMIRIDCSRLSLVLIVFVVEVEEKRIDLLEADSGINIDLDAVC